MPSQIAWLIWRCFAKRPPSAVIFDLRRLRCSVSGLCKKTGRMIPPPRLEARCLCQMRFLDTAVVLSTLSLTSACAPASSLGDSPTPLIRLQEKADQAQPRDRCFLYAELISKLTDRAGQQFNSGDSARASETLQLVQRYAEMIHVDVADDSKKLKDAEVLMQRTSFRLTGILSEASYEDRQVLETTLKQLNQIQAQLMMQVFKK